MAKETEKVEEVRSPEEIAAEQAAAEAAAEATALAEFEEGFTGTTVEPPKPDDKPGHEPVSEVVIDETKEVVDEPVVEGEGEHKDTPVVTPPVAEAPKTDITPDQLKQILEAVTSIGDVRTALDKLRGDVFGKVGGFERTLKSLQESTPQGEAIELSTEDLAELKEQYPDLTEKMLTGLKRMFGKLKGTGPSKVNQEEIDQRIETRANEIAQLRIDKEREERRVEVASQIVETQHEGWRTIVGPKGSDTAFRRWLKAQGPQYEAEFLSSMDPAVVSRALTKFKASEATPPKPKPKTPVVDPSADRRQRVAQAVPPRGTGAKPPAPRAKTPEEEFAEGFTNR